MRAFVVGKIDAGLALTRHLGLKSRFIKKYQITPHASTIIPLISHLEFIKIRVVQYRRDFKTMESQKKLHSMKLKIRNRAPDEVDMDCSGDTHAYPAEKPTIEIDEDILDRLDLLASLFHHHPVE